MNFIKTKKSPLLLGLFAAYAFSNFSAFANPGIPLAQEEKSPISPADHLVGDAQKQLDQIAIIFVTLSGIISTKQVTLVNKPKILTKLRSMSSFIQTLRDRKFVESDIPLAYEFLHLNSLIMSYALNALDTNFANIEKSSLEALIKSKPMPAEVDINQTAQLLMKNQYMLAQLTYKIDNYGLRWYNHAYRAFDDYVISPCNRYSIPRRVLFVLGSAFFCNYMWRQVHYDSYEKHCPRWLKLGKNKPKESHGVPSAPQAQEERTYTTDQLLEIGIKVYNRGFNDGQNQRRGANFRMFTQNQGAAAQPANNGENNENPA